MGWWVLMLASAGAVSMDEMGHGCCGDPAHLGYAGCEQGGLWHAIIHVRCPPYRAQNPSMLLPSSVRVITWCPHPSMKGGAAGCRLGAWCGTRLGDVVIIIAGGILGHVLIVLIIALWWSSSLSSSGAALLKKVE